MPTQEYHVFRRTPSTGSVFDPDTDTPIVIVDHPTTEYDDIELEEGTYDWQVFAWDGTEFSSGSTVITETVSAVGVSVGTFTVNDITDVLWSGDAPLIGVSQGTFNVTDETTVLWSVFTLIPRRNITVEWDVPTKSTLIIDNPTVAKKVAVANLFTSIDKPRSDVVLNVSSPEKNQFIVQEALLLTSISSVHKQSQVSGPKGI